MTKKIYTQLALFLTAIFFSIVANAAYEISPVKLKLDAQNKVASVTIKNTNNEETSFQTKILKMVKKNGHESWVEAKELVIVTPAVFRLAPGKSQLIRLAMRGPISHNEDKYTLSVKELPMHGPRNKDSEGAPMVHLVTDFRVPITIGGTQ